MVLANNRDTPPSFRSPVVGSELQDVLTTQGKQVTRPGATKAEADIDIQDTDIVADGDFETDILDIGGTSGIAFAVNSNSGHTFEIQVEVYDDNDNLRTTIDSTDFTSLGGTRATTVIPVFGDRVKFVITDTSNQPANEITGSINVNIGTPEKITSEIRGGSLQIQGDDGATFADAALNTAASDSDVSLVTYLSRALNSKSLDEFVTRVTDSTGSQVDPLTRNVTENIATDYVRSSFYGEDPNGDLVRLQLDSNGEIEASLEAETVGVSGDDDDGNTLDVNAETLSQAIADPDGLVTYLARSLNSQGQDQLVSRLTDTAGSQVNPDQSPDYPDNRTVEHDLDPNAQSDLVVGPLPVARAEGILLSGNSIDGQNWSASADWLDSDGNVFQTQSATDLGLSGVTDENARVYRKAPQVQVTVTSEAAAGTQNRINFYVDSHR